jgi:glycosyltransferase involved in cell wall biosynthesis
VKHLIVIPAYNEEEALPATVGNLQSLPDHFELLVVNDGSRDGTGRVAEQLARSSRLPMHVLHLPCNGGIGVAVQSGYLFAAKLGRYQYVFQFDADGQHDSSYILPMLEHCQQLHLDLCVGSRFLHVTSDSFRSTFTRRLGIRFFSWLIRALTRVQLTDPTSGFRCAGPRAWKRFAVSYPEDYPEPESLFWCARSGLRIAELPVRMHTRQGGVSSINPYRSAYYMLKVSLAILLDRLRRREN